MTNLLEPGTEVEWTSVSNGSEKTKRGIVVKYVAGSTPMCHRGNWRSLSDQINQDFAALGITVTASDFKMVQATSQRDRYLVIVPRTHRRTGEPLPAKVYTPVASLVKAVEVTQ